MLIRVWFKDGYYLEKSYEPGSYQVSYDEWTHGGVDQIIIDVDVYSKIV